MFDLKKQAERFKDHVAKFVDYGNIKILDFGKPGDSSYRIRFLFEEDYCRLHISGDLGELIACNYENMRYEKFFDSFVHNVGYFESKIKTCSRPIYCFDYDQAVKDLEEFLGKYELVEEDEIQEKVEEILQDFDDDTGIGSKGCDVLSEIDSDWWEYAGSGVPIGKVKTGILDLYMLAYELAWNQLKKEEQ